MLNQKEINAREIPTKSGKTKTLLFATALLISMCANSQSFKQGTIAADLSVGVRIYGARIYSPVNKQEFIGVFIGLGLPTATAEYGVFNFLGVGAKYSRGAYAQSGFKVRTNDFSACVNFHVANKKDKFDLPITVAYGWSKFKADANGANEGSKQFIHTQGSVINLAVSPHIYFGKYVGMFIRLGYNKYLYNHIVINDGNKDYTEADGAKWQMGGLDFALGVAGKF